MGGFTPGTPVSTPWLSKKIKAKQKETNIFISKEKYKSIISNSTVDLVFYSNSFFYADVFRLWTIEELDTNWPIWEKQGVIYLFHIFANWIRQNEVPQ